jgi:kynureninase
VSAGSSAPIGAAEIDSWRRELPILGSTVYLVNHSLGPMPRAVEGELAAYAREWRERGVRAWMEGWWEASVATGDLLAPILGVAPGTIAMHPNVSVALAVLLSALDYPAGKRRIVTVEGEFHTDQYVLDGERRKGADLVVVPAAADRGVDLDRLLATIDEHARLVLVSHVLFETSTRVDAAAIARRCREVGALFVLDVYQSAGAVPVELAAWGVDAAVGGSVKWLCGGPGAGFLYVDPELAPRLEPTATGWQADSEPFAFRPGPIRRAQGARRFLTGTPAVPALYACRPGYRLIGEVGVERIRARSVALTERLIAAADAHGLEVRSPRDSERRGGAVTVFHPDGARLGERLAAENVLCDHRPGSGLRFGPHFFNTEDEIEQAIARLAELALESDRGATGCRPVRTQL